jgi:hypothetical protein
VKDSLLFLYSFVLLMLFCFVVVGGVLLYDRNDPACGFECFFFLAKETGKG